MLRCLLSITGVGLLAVTLGCGGGSGGPPAPMPPPPGPGEGSTAVQAGVDAVVGDTASVFQFFGQASDIEEGVVGFGWDFDGDGTADSTIDRPSWGFGAGTHQVELTLTNAGGDENVAEVAIGVRDPAAPAAPLPPGVVLRVWTLHGSAPAQVVCHAIAEDPDGGTITDYAFDIDGDGTDDVTGASPSAVFTLAAAGTYKPRVTVTDDESATSTASATLVLCDAATYPDQSPSAMIAVPSGEALTDTSTALDLAALGSDIDGGAIASVDWDTDGDGLFDDLTGREVSPTFATEGIHRVRVRLTDDEGNAASEAAIDVLVSDTAPTTGRPSAWAWAEALVAAPSQDVLFHVAATGGDAPLTFSWDFDGDGTEDSTAPHPRHRFGTPGLYRPRCTVTDGDGDVSSSAFTLLVEPCDATVAPFFRYACDDLLMMHGGTAELQVTPQVTAGSAPTFYGLLHKSGPAGEDPDADDLDVQDHTMQALPPATAPVAVPGSGIVALELESLAVDGPPRVTCYEVGLRLEHPGVRVQVLTCQVCVAHDLFRAGLFSFDVGDNWRGTLSAVMDTGPFGTLPGTPPSVYELELVFADFTPALTEIIPPVLPSSGWSEGSTAGGHRFFTTTLPIEPGVPQKLFTFDYDTNVGAPQGPALTGGEVVLRDENGRRVGRAVIPFP